MKKRYLLITLFFFLPLLQVHADYAQLVNSQNVVTNTSGAEYVETLGTGLSGTWSSVTMQIKQANGGNTPNINLFMEKCTTASYATCTLVFNSVQQINANVQGDLTYSTSTSPTFDPSSYYYIGITTSGICQCTGYGSASDTYPGGSATSSIAGVAFSSQGSISDYFFDIASSVGTQSQILSVFPTSTISTGTSTTAVSIYVGCDSSPNIYYIGCVTSPEHTLYYSLSPLNTFLSSPIYYSSTTAQTGIITFQNDVNFADSDVWQFHVVLSDANNYLLESEDYTFTVGGGTNIQNLVNQGGLITSGLTGSTSTTTITTPDCQILNFNAINCFYYLFVPPEYTGFNGWVNQMEHIFPLGYALRVENIFISSATSTLPSLTFTMPVFGGLPNAGESIDLTPWQDLEGPTSYVRTATSTITGETFYDSYEPYWQDLVMILFGFAVLRLIIKLEGGIRGVSRSASGKDRSVRNFDITNFHNHYHDN